MTTKKMIMDPTAAAITAGPSSRHGRSVMAWAVACVLTLGLQLLLFRNVHEEVPDSFMPPAPAEVTATYAVGSWPVETTPPVGAEPSSTDAVTIGVAVTVTGCGASFPLDGAIVLRHSILRQPSERYKYHFYAIYHPSAAECVPPLADAGYTLLERDTPVNVTEIRDNFLRRTISKSGCCGEKELIKFEAFLLTQHPAVILMDMDMLVLKPLDDLIDLILYNNPTPEFLDLHLDNVSAHEARTATGNLWLLYVNDYVMAKPPYHFFPSQGGFAVLKPNRTIYSEIQQIVLEGKFHPKLGWGNVTGPVYGGMTVQGLLPYYFKVLHPGFALALDGCIHDHMHVPAGRKVMHGNESVMRCYAPDCQNCERTPFEDIYSVHVTSRVGKAWHCSQYSGRSRHVQMSLGTWFQYRSELEKSWGRFGRGSSNATHPAMHGYCSAYGKEGYEPIQQPYGRPA